MSRVVPSRDGLERTALIGQNEKSAHTPVQPMGRQFEKAIRRTVATCGLCAGAIALLAMLSWVFGNWRIGALGDDYVPMAPVTALMLILLSGGLVVYRRWSASRAARRFALFALASIGGLGLLIWAQRLIGIQTSVERWLTPATYTAGGVPVGLMSPLTALTIPLYIRA